MIGAFTVIPSTATSALIVALASAVTVIRSGDAGGRVGIEPSNVGRPFQRADGSEKSNVLTGQSHHAGTPVDACGRRERASGDEART